VEILDRYLQAVRFWLPREQRDDIAAELEEEIRSQVEERRRTSGEPSDADVEAILDRWGSPLLVAERYLPAQHLIGPALFPLYRLALKFVSLVYLVPWLLVWVGLLSFHPAYRAEHLGPGRMAGDLASWWLIAVHLFAAITIGFALVERSQAASGSLHTWRRKTLPPPDPNHVPRTRSLGELLGAVLFILWWLDVLRLPAIPVTLAPVWRTLHWPILAVYLGIVAVAAVNLWRPWWTRRRARARLVVNGAGLALSAALLAAGHWIDVVLPVADPAALARIERVERWADLSLFAPTLAFSCVYFLLRGVQDLRRLRKQSPIRNWAFRLMTEE
jgi:hypothetical protein